MLVDAVGPALPNEDDLAAELLGDAADTGFVGNERAVLLGIALDVNGRL